MEEREEKNKDMDEQNIRDEEIGDLEQKKRDTSEQEHDKKTIDDYKADYYYFTGKASEIVRSLALAGIAVVWIFKSSGETITIAGPLFIASKWFIIALALDLTQYVAGSIIWYFYYKYLEKLIKRKVINPKEDIKAPSILPFIINIFFLFKVLASIIAYCYLLGYLSTAIQST